MNAIRSELYYILFYSVFIIKTIVSRIIRKTQLSKFSIYKIYFLLTICFTTKTNIILMFVNTFNNWYIMFYKELKSLIARSFFIY